MEPNYGNWVPKGMVNGFFGGFGVAAVLFYALGCSPLLPDGALKTVLFWVLLALTVVLGVAACWMLYMHRAFSYTGTRQMARQIIEGIAEQVTLPEGGVGLDVGCGSGALAIACAKRNPQGRMVGIDRWGKEYGAWSKSLCERNAEAEGLANVTFAKGDAVKLDFPDECFDAVTSNYVYHNIPLADRQALLLETLRTLKKGGVFAIHDIMSRRRYGDMDAFAQKLRDMGYEDVRVIDTTDGLFMTPREAATMDLAGSKLLVGTK